MKTFKIAMLLMIVVSLVLQFAFASDIAKGKALFNDPKFGGGISGKSCNSCHANGSGLEKAADKKEFMGGKAKSLEGAVNMCIEMMLKGKAIDPKSADMANIVAHIESLKGKTPAAMPKK